MKRMLNCAFAYAIAAMAGGVFYREFTKFSSFTGATALGKVHTHLFLLGMVMFLLAALFVDRLPVANQKTFRVFLVTYNIGVPLTAVMLLVRGVMQVTSTPLSGGMDAAISGMAGVGHILTGVGIILLILALRKAAGNKTGQEE